MLKDVLLMSATPPPEGGIATWTKEYLEYCSAHNYLVDLINIAMTGSRRARVTNGKRNYIDEIFRTKDILRNLKKAYKSNKYKICHVNSSCSKFGIIRDYLCVRIAKKEKSKVVFHCHCHVPTQINNWFQIKILKQICSISDEIIVLNDKSKVFIEKLVEKTIILLPNYVDINKNYNCKIIKHDINKVVYVGHVIRQKGIDIILETARKNPKIDFLLVGPIDEYYTKVSIPENVFMLGTKKHDDVISFLEDADVFLFPSYSEGFSVSLLEAMFYGLPIIASDVGANKDMIKNEGGVILGNIDYESISKALSMIKDFKVRECMSSWNHNRVIEVYSKEKVLGSLFCLYGLEAT